jgi:hypothetical protein
MLSAPALHLCLLSSRLCFALVILPATKSIERHTHRSMPTPATLPIAGRTTGFLGRRIPCVRAASSDSSCTARAAMPHTRLLPLAFVYKQYDEPEEPDKSGCMMSCLLDGSCSGRTLRCKALPCCRFGDYRCRTLLARTTAVLLFAFVSHMRRNNSILLVVAAVISSCLGLISIINIVWVCLQLTCS